MKKNTLILTAALILALVAAPALAAMRVISDSFDRGTGTGVAVVQMNATTFAKIMYRDLDGTESFTSGDLRLRTEFIRRDDLDRDGLSNAPRSRPLE